MHTHPATLVSEVLDMEIMRGNHNFLFPANRLSEDDIIVREVADRIGCHNLVIGMSAITAIDKRTKDFKALFTSSPVVEEFKSHNVPLPRKWFVARI